MFSRSWGFSGCSFFVCSAGSFLRAAGEGSISLGSRSFPITPGLGLLWATGSLGKLNFSQCRLSRERGSQGVQSGGLFYGEERASLGL